MGLSIAKQTSDFLLAGGLGAALSVLYDLFRVLRRRIRGAAFTAALDALFWILAVAAFLLFSMVVMGGDLRLYVFLGTGLGAILYFFTLSPLLTGLLDSLLDLIHFLILQILRPFRAVCAFLSKLLSVLHKSVKNSFQIAKKKCMIIKSIKTPLRRRERRKPSPSRTAPGKGR